MPYQVVNGSDAVAIDLAEPDNADFIALGFHRTGVVSGGTVTQSGSPSMTVQVADAEIVIDGTPITKAAGPVVLDASTSSPRFDVIGWNVTGGPVAIKGIPSGTNPVHPAFDPTTFCITGIVLISASAVSITNPYIVQKQVAPHVSLRRKYVNDSDVVLEWATPLKTNSFKALASGTLSWVSSVLTRTADAAMEWATSLTIRQTSATEKALILKAASGAAKGNNILEVQSATSATSLAAIDGIGRLSGLNFRTGVGAPENVVTADKGTLYLNEDPTDGNTALYVKLTNGVATGWAALASYIAASQALPVGSVVAWPGIIGTDALPIGYLYCDGTEKASATYPALSTWAGSKFGTASAGNFRLPDYRGRTLFGVDGTLATGPGVNVGAATVTLSVEQLPAHNHPVVDSTHDHPQGGQYFYKVEQAYLPPYHLPVNNQSGVGADVEVAGTPHAAATLVTVGPTGGGLPFSTLQPSQSVNFLMKT